MKPYNKDLALQQLKEANTKKSHYNDINNAIEEMVKEGYETCSVSTCRCDYKISSELVEEIIKDYSNEGYQITFNTGMQSFHIKL